MPEIYEVEYDVEDYWITCPFNQGDGTCKIEEIDCFTLENRSIPGECPLLKGGVLVRLKKEKP